MRTLVLNSILVVGLASALVGCASTPGLDVDYLGAVRNSAATLRIRAAQAVLQGRARSSAAWAELGQAWLARARITFDPMHVRRASDAFDRAESLGNDIGLVRGKIELALFREHFATALKLADAGIATHPHDARILAARCDAWLGLGEIARAEAELDGAALALPDAHPLVRARALVLRARGRNDAAVEFLRRAARASRSNADAADDLALAGAAAFDAHHEADARSLADEALALDPLHHDATLLRAELDLAVHDWHAAIARCTHWLELDDSPLLAARAIEAARELDDRELVFQLVNHVELALRDSFDPRETYVLRALTEVYAAERDNLDEALDFARQRAQVVHTAEARGMVEQLELLRSSR